MLLLTFINCRTMTGTLSCFYRWLNCLMPDTSSYLMSCRYLLRAGGITTLFAAYFRDDEFLKHIHRILQVCQDLWYSCVCLLFFFFLKGQQSKNISCIPELTSEGIARVLGNHRNGQTPTLYILYGRSLYKALISFVKMACPSLEKFLSW